MRNSIVGILVAILSLTCIVGQARPKGNGIVEGSMFKWTENGAIHYGYVVPPGIATYETITLKGKKEDIPDDGEFKLVQPTKKDATAEARAKNCIIAKNNKVILGSGPVFEKDAAGDITEVPDEAKKTKLSQAEKDIAYFCN